MAIKWGKLDLSKMRDKLRKINDRRRKQTRKGHDHADLDAQWQRMIHKIHVEERWRKEHKPEKLPDGWVPFDGRMVAGWMVEEVLTPARASRVWQGIVFSGQRSVALCIELCQNLCHQNSCPGICGGSSSNHVGPPSFKGVKYEGAVDVTDPEGLQRWCRAHGNPLHGNGEMLPADRAHFSRSGR